jgi:endonuclease/exonuclease/phosphatase family metal-dependent hydrolase
MHRFLFFVCVASAISCAPWRPPLQSAPTAPALTCVGSPETLQWADISDKTHRGDLDSWCSSVGAPLVWSSPSLQAGEARRLLILSWNVHVGGGHVKEAVEELLDRFDEGHNDTGIVLLLQEAFRAGDVVPESFPRIFKTPGRIAPKRLSSEIGRLAEELGMSVAYVPSMRNGNPLAGEDREDRGSAILSTEPLSDIIAIELPMLKQRRVVVMATVTPRGSHVPPLRVMTTHLDTLGPRGTQAKALANYISELPAEPPLVMGGDLNSLWGVRDTTVTTMSTVMSMEPCGTGRTHVFGRFDYIFSTLGPTPARTCETLQNKFSSDHRPVLLTLEY